MLKSLRQLLHAEAMTVSGRRRSARSPRRRSGRDQKVIHSTEQPIKPDGGLAVLWGNLAPEGSLVKKSAAVQKMWVHEGPAVVFDSMEAATEVVVKRRGRSPAR